MTPIMWAASYGHVEVIKLLLHADATTNCINKVSLSVCPSVCLSAVFLIMMHRAIQDQFIQHQRHNGF